MNNEYQIIDIKGGEDSRFGDIVIVKANPVETNSLGLKFVSTTLGLKTDTFLFPEEEHIINPILAIARGQGIWRPEKDDFEEESIFNEDKNTHVKIYRHISFWSDDYDESFNSGHIPELIGNKRHKASQLSEQYINNGWYQSMSLYEYVVSLAEGDDVQNFCGWLFDDPSLNNRMIWDLPKEYQDCFVDFLDQFMTDTDI